MVYTAYEGFLKGGWLIFWLVLFSILTVAVLIWVFLYFQTSQNKSRKMSIFIIVLNVLIIAFEIQLILIKANVIL
ncbi:MAG: hypothetical protein ACTSQE_00925 [Candidatus Heimdallarchaeaceae archaeon]